MNRTWAAAATSGTTLTMCLVMTGCAAFESRGVQEEYRGSLGDGRTITLTQEIRRDLWRNDAQHNYTELVLSLWADDEPLVEQSLARVEGDVKENPAFDLGELEGHASGDGNRVWFIDKKAARIVASYDFSTKLGTGPSDAAPEWAALRNGVALERLEP